MSYVAVSLPKKSGNPGAPLAKDPNVIIVLAKDLDVFPPRDSKGVLIAGDITVKTPGKAISFYVTPSSINRWDTTEGDQDEAGFIQNFTATRPGDDLEFSELVTELLGEPCIIISKACAELNGVRVQGSPCNPMVLQFENQDNNEANKSTLTFTSSQRSRFKTAHYRGAIPEVAADTDYDSGSGSGGI